MTATDRADSTIEYGTLEPVRVYHDDLDSMGLLHNARYAVVLERALVDYWDRQGYTFTNGVLGHPDAFVAVAEYTIRYRAPKRGTGVINVHLWVDRYGESSVVYGFRMLSEDRATIYAEGSRVQIRLDPKTLRPTPWAEETCTLYTSLQQR